MEIELTAREKDIYDHMKEKADRRTGTLRVNLAPSKIRDYLAAKYPGISAHNVTLSQERLVREKLLIPIRDPENSMKVKKPVLTYQINEKMEKTNGIRIIEKRKHGFSSGTHKRDRSWDFLKEKKKNLERISEEISQMAKELECRIQEQRQAEINFAIALVLVSQLCFQGGKK